MLTGIHDINPLGSLVNPRALPSFHQALHILSRNSSHRREVSPKPPSPRCPNGISQPLRCQLLSWPVLHRALSLSLAEFGLHKSLYTSRLERLTRVGTQF